MRCVVGRMDRLEADLAGRSLADLRVERPGEELPPEADAEERDPALEALPDEVGGLLDEGLLVGMLHVERGAEDDDPSDVVERRSRVRLVERVPHGDRPARALHGRGRDPERLRGIASNEEDVAIDRECSRSLGVPGRHGRANGSALAHFARATITTSERRQG